MELKIVSKSKDNQQVYKKRGENSFWRSLRSKYQRPSKTKMRRNKYTFKKKTIKAPEPNIHVEGAN